MCLNEEAETKRVPAPRLSRSKGRPVEGMLGILYSECKGDTMPFGLLSKERWWGKRVSARSGPVIERGSRDHYARLRTRQPGPVTGSSAHQYLGMK